MTGHIEFVDHYSCPAADAAPADHYARPGRPRWGARAGAALGLTLLCLAASPGHTAEAYDPLEPMNIRIHAFNEYVDDKVMRPVANTYVRFIPRFARRGVSNFFSNLNDITVFANNLLQLKLGNAASDAGRILLNSTVGFGGLVDVATDAGLMKNQEDFGQTLGYWGVPSGPYLVIPLFGPSTLRDGLGFATDTLTHPMNQQDDVRVRNSLFALQQLDRRVAALAVDSLMMGDTYIFTREAYLQQREYLVTDGEISDDWDDDEWGAWD